jgi:preprotein translocase subunit SecG
MLTFLSIVHIFIGVGLVAFVLLQDPKGGAAGLFGGGSSSTSFFGASGANNFLTTATKWLAVTFAISCLLLTALTAKKPTSVLDSPDAQAPITTGLPPVPNAQVPANTAPAATNPNGGATPNSAAAAAGPNAPATSNAAAGPNNPAPAESKTAAPAAPPVTPEHK